MPNLPLFITGNPRSGTTLLRLIFNSHPEIAIPDETGIFNIYFERGFFQRLMPFKASRYPRLIKSFGEEIITKFDALPADKRNDPKKGINFLFREHAKKIGLQCK